MKGLPCDDDIDWQELIRVTDGYSGADLANVCRDAAMMPLRKKIAEGNFDILKMQAGMKEDFDVPLT